ncbi:MAG TPA: Na+/H+ antiporter subunit D, partial [Acidimicrobiales bacterium]
MNALLPVPIVLPLIGAALSILSGRSRTAQRVLGISVLGITLAVSIVIFVHVDDEGPLVAHAGGWQAPLGITLIADRLSALMLVVGALMLLVVLLYAIGQPGA